MKTPANPSRPIGILDLAAAVAKAWRTAPKALRVAALRVGQVVLTNMLEREEARAEPEPNARCWCGGWHKREEHRKP